MARIRVTVRDKTGTSFLDNEIKSLKNLVEKDTRKLAETFAKTVKDTIQRKAKNPTGKLASGFYAHPITNGWAVGDINELDATLPYWNHVDKGSLAIGANWEHVLPKGKWVNNLWVASQDGYWFVPSKPIASMNYIAESLQIMEVLTPQILKG